MERSEHGLKVLILTTILTGVLALAGCSGSNAPSSTSSGTTSTAPIPNTTVTASSTPLSESSATLAGADAESSEASSEERAEAKIKETAISGEWIVQVTGRSFAPNAGGAQAPAGSRLVVVSLMVRNGSAKARAIGVSDFVLTDPSGKVLSAAKTTSKAFIMNLAQPVAPGATVKFSIAYTAPIADTRFELKFAPTVTGVGAVPVTFAIE
jgi:Domain of unknown function (DUF4352)